MLHAQSFSSGQLYPCCVLANLNAWCRGLAEQLCVGFNARMLSGYCSVALELATQRFDAGTVLTKNSDREWAARHQSRSGAQW